MHTAPEAVKIKGWRIGVEKGGGGGGVIGVERGDDATSFGELSATNRCSTNGSTVIMALGIYNWAKYVEKIK